MMTLLEAVNRYGNSYSKDFTFFFTKLSKVCEKFQKQDFQTVDFNQRLYKLNEKINKNGLSILRNSDLRFLINIVNLKEFENFNLFEIFNEIETRNKQQLFRTIFNSFLNNYNSKYKATFQKFIIENYKKFPTTIREFLDKTSILHSVNILDSISREVAISENPNFTCTNNLISEFILVTKFGALFKLDVLKYAVALNDEDQLKKIIVWCYSNKDIMPNSEVYYILLSNYLSMEPSAGIKRIITDFLLNVFKDPRLFEWPDLDNDENNIKKQSCIKLFRQWLALDDLNLFIEIINETALDRMWKERRDFWLRYFKNKLVSDVTLILASSSDKLAKRIRESNEESNHLNWSKLLGGSSNHSVILMKIGDIIISEWSHNGATRFWKSNQIGAPEFHKRIYNAAELRKDSIPLKFGAVESTSLIHDSDGKWRKKLEKNIEYFSGVKII